MRLYMSDLHQSSQPVLSALSVEDAAREFGVSKSTIRNWIRLGHIDSVGRSGVDYDSLMRFRRDVIGDKKLNHRANKQHNKSQDSRTPYNPLQWQSYEPSLDESHRNKEGIYYTPENIVEDLCSLIAPCDFSDKLFLDPCCGSGNFLIQALKMGFLPQNIYGFDTDAQAVAITRQRIKEFTGVSSRNIKCADFLDIADSLPLRADYIFTNPPWGKKIDRAVRQQLFNRYSAGRSADSSSLFIYASLMLLKRGGSIGFLLQEAFFNVAAYSHIRERLFGMNVDYLIDYGRPFKSILTKAQAIVATDVEGAFSPIICRYGGVEYIRSRASFGCNPQLIFNMTVTPADSELIERILKSDGSITLGGNAQWGMGIVTGDNSRYCSPKPRVGYREVWRGAEVVQGGFKPAVLYIDPNLSQYQQVAPIEAYESPCKIVYKFISSRLCFACDTEQRFILNSANFLILADDFPISAEELVKFLNCDFTNWLFQKIFSTRKILRSNLEMLPIFLECFDNGRFCEATYLDRLHVKKVESGGFVTT